MSMRVVFIHKDTPVTEGLKDLEDQYAMVLDELGFTMRRRWQLGTEYRMWLALNWARLSAEPSKAQMQTD